LNTAQKHRALGHFSETISFSDKVNSPEEAVWDGGEAITDVVRESNAKTGDDFSHDFGWWRREARPHHGNETNRVSG